MWGPIIGVVSIGIIIALGWLRDRNQAFRMVDNYYEACVLWLAEASYHTIRIFVVGVFLLLKSIWDLGKSLLSHGLSWIPTRSV